MDWCHQIFRKSHNDGYILIVIMPIMSRVACLEISEMSHCVFFYYENHRFYHWLNHFLFIHSAFEAIFTQWNHSHSACTSTCTTGRCVNGMLTSEVTSALSFFFRKSQAPPLAEPFPFHQQCPWSNIYTMKSFIVSYSQWYTNLILRYN